MFIELGDAVTTAAVFREASSLITIPHVAAPLAGAAAEWQTAAELLDELGGEYGITMLGTLVRGMKVANPKRRHEAEDERVTVNRVAPSPSGGWFLHYEDPNGINQSGLYDNYAGPTSPVVAWRGTN